MRKICMILIIALILSFIALPVIADNGGRATHDSNLAGGDNNNGQSHGNERGVGGNITQIPETENQNDEGHGAFERNGSVVPPGWIKNPNQVRDAVHALLDVENRTGGIGPQVSAIAREFNNSVNASQRDEDLINNQGLISRFFFGGDKQAATELANLTAENVAQISEIENLMNTTTLDPDTRTNGRATTVTAAECGI